MAEQNKLEGIVREWYFAKGLGDKPIYDSDMRKQLLSYYNNNKEKISPNLPPEFADMQPEEIIGAKDDEVDAVRKTVQSYVNKKLEDYVTQKPDEVLDKYSGNSLLETVLAIKPKDQESDIAKQHAKCLGLNALERKSAETGDASEIIDFVKSYFKEYADEMYLYKTIANYDSALRSFNKIKGNEINKFMQYFSKTEGDKKVLDEKALRNYLKANIEGLSPQEKTSAYASLALKAYKK